MDTSEVRWFAPGPMPSGVGEWFAAQTTINTTEDRFDTYLLHGIEDIGIKYRDRRTLEVKRRHSIGADIALGPGLRAPLVRWQKWRPQELDGSWSAPDVGRIDVHKTVMKSSYALVHDAVAPSDLLRDGQTPACTIEIATVVVEGVSSWTLGLEASGPIEFRRRMLQDAWHLVSAGTLPDIGFASCFDVAAAYPEWLEQHLPCQLAG